MTTHEMALRLLAMPNMPIATHKHWWDSTHATPWHDVGLLKSSDGESIVIRILPDSKRSE